jgi:CheY-like chemotaxis protein
VNDQIIFIEAMSEVAPGTLVLLADNSGDALEMMKECRVTPDCIFLELYMPGADGIDFLRKIKSISILRDIPIIVHADNYQPQMVRPLKEIGVVGIYSRPYQYDGVCNALHVYFNENNYASLN